MNVRPLADNIIVEPMEREEKTPSGIVLPDTAKEKPQEGKIVAVGPGKLVDGERVEPEVEKGMHVLFKKWGGNEVRVEGRELLIVREEDILAIFED
ncbi:MAG: co-chaperone GroES [Patescibacteria group bacterium]